PAAVSFGGGTDRGAATRRLRGGAGPGDGRAPAAGHRRRRRPGARPVHLDPGHAAAARVPAGLAAARGDAGAGSLDPPDAALGMGDHHCPEMKKEPTGSSVVSLVAAARFELATFGL